MTRLIRWAHLPDGRIAVLWADDAFDPPRLYRTVADGLTLTHHEGEPLDGYTRMLVAGDAFGYSLTSPYYAGVVEPASEALCS